MMLGFRLFKVLGHKVTSIISGESFAILYCWFKGVFIKPGKQLVLQHPNYGYMVKTVEFIDGEGIIWCRGLGLTGLPCEQLTAIRQHQVVGVVVWCFNLPKQPSQINT